MTVDPRSLRADKSAPEASTAAAVPSGHLALRAMRRMQRFIKRICMSGVRRLPTAHLEALIHHVVAQRVTALPADEALRFLFRLDAALYPLQGQKAIEHDGGIHTKHRHTRYHDFFVKHVHPGERVLDIGCGMGAVAYDVADKARACVVGIDLSSENIAMARQRHAHPRVQFHVGDALQEVPQAPFDVVILSNVLEHVPQRPEFLCRVMQLASPSRFLIRAPLFERDWRVPLKRELGVEWRLDPTHETEYTLESFTEEMATAGLRIRHQEVRWGEIWAEVVPDAS
jgi:2-polyprenyl-3-methyl-5-hydroxy-6-metoxy-1,4-benzoquinol methylase